EDSALGLGYLASKVLKFGNLRSERIKALAQSKMTIIQSRTIIHCAPLSYYNAPEGLRWTRPHRLGKLGNLVCPAFDIGCTFKARLFTKLADHLSVCGDRFSWIAGYWPASERGGLV
ncbi:hypothetical protein, partial [Bradyrhizobium sp. 142]|uniref:hypothetical protein n=1 Tax=Bradyrhizobium sp. 142 TaxID=2782618 RepID=UPI001FF9AA97